MPALPPPRHSIITPKPNAEPLQTTESTISQKGETRVALSRTTARRLLRLLERRLRALADLMDVQGAQGDETKNRQERLNDLEREAKAIAALLKTLQAAGLDPAREWARTPDHAIDTATLRRRLARRLEGLLAPTRPPRRSGADAAQGAAPDRRPLGAERPG